MLEFLWKIIGGGPPPEPLPVKTGWAAVSPGDRIIFEPAEWAHIYEPFAGDVVRFSDNRRSVEIQHAGKKAWYMVDCVTLLDTVSKQDKEE